MTHPVPIILVADAASRAEMAEKINAHSDYTAVAAPTKHGLLSQEEDGAPQVVVIDTAAEHVDWVSLVYALKKGRRPPPVIVLDHEATRANLLSAFREGADGYLEKQAWRRQIIPAIKAALAGLDFYSHQHMDAIREHMVRLELGKASDVAEVQDGIALLTVREKEVFPLLAEGKSIKETAEILGISSKTVETHKYHIMEKLQLTSMAQWTITALNKDLIPL